MSASTERGSSILIGKEYLHEFVSDPLWYLQFDRLAQLRSLGFGAIRATLSHPFQAPTISVWHRILDEFERLLAAGEVALGGPDQGLYEWDSEREEIDTVVIHHSRRAHGISLGTLNAMELLRLYVPVYQHPAPSDKDRTHGKPIYSGHFRDGTQVFYPYHWLVRQDGSVERLLEDSQIGWHAGNWGINKRSVGICLDDDLEHKAPNGAMIEAVRTLLREDYGDLSITNESLLGHFEVNSTTVCPGDQFTHGFAWKNLLL